jgi:hypothetical protein
MPGVGGILLGLLAAGALVELNVGDLDCGCDDTSAAAISSELIGSGDAAFSTGCAATDTGDGTADDLACTCVIAGVIAGEVLCAGGGGNGAMPTPLLSLAAAAAAAEAYLNVSPGGLTGAGAGFITLSFGIVDGCGTLFKDANRGNGDFSCVDGLRVTGISDFDDFFVGMGGSGSLSSCCPS